jgi:hypothetical protein
MNVMTSQSRDLLEITDPIIIASLLQVCKKGSETTGVLIYVHPIRTKNDFIASKGKVVYQVCTISIDFIRSLRRFPVVLKWPDPCIRSDEMGLAS